MFKAQLSSRTATLLTKVIPTGDEVMRAKVHVQKNIRAEY